MKKVLVTGGCGFIGSNFIDYLLRDSEVQENIHVINLDKHNQGGSHWVGAYGNLNKNQIYFTSLISYFFSPAGVVIFTVSLLFFPIKPFPIGDLK